MVSFGEFKPIVFISMCQTNLDAEQRKECYIINGPICGDSTRNAGMGQIERLSRERYP